MLKVIDVRINERAVVLKNGLPKRALGPGRHWIWGLHTEALVFDTDQLVLRGQPAVRELLRESFAEVKLERHERGIVFRDGRPALFLRPGTHRVWTVDPSVELVVHRLDEPLPKLTDELLALIPKGEIVLATVHEHERGLCFVQGKLVRVLEPGRHAFWTHPEAQVGVEKLDMRLEQTAIAGQELMTRDKVTLRLTLTVEHAIVDPALAATRVTNVRDAVYLVVQLAAREFVAGVTLDELLDGRDAMTRFLENDAAEKVARFGVKVARVGVKDVVLPGEMKTLLNRVIEAEKEAAVRVILRREEVAATRQLANTARVMADNPVLLRLEELDALKEIAERIGEVRVVVGADSFRTLLPAELLGKKLLTSNEDGGN